MGDDWAPLDEHESAAQIDALLTLARARRWSRAVDLGCGAGRTTIPLARAGVRVLGVDRDPGALRALNEAARAAGVDPLVLALAHDFTGPDSDAFAWVDGGRPDAALLLGNTLMEVHDVQAAVRLFSALRGALAPGGILVVDNLPRDVWRDVADGAWQEGVSEDGRWQMVWAEGDAVVALRRDDDVDPDDWTVREHDRKVRLWSLGSLRLLALSSGLRGPDPDASGALLVFGTT